MAVPARRTHARDDAQIKAAVCRALTDDPNVDARRVEVKVVSGTAYLRGVVLSSEEAERASHDAQSTPGVRDVVCELEVPPPD